MNEKQLFDMTPNPVAGRQIFKGLTFGGKTYEPALDFERLDTQLAAVFRIMRDGQWRTITEIRFAIQSAASEAGISARLRDLRKPQFGSHTVARQRRGDGRTGTFEYRLIINPRSGGDHAA